MVIPENAIKIDDFYYYKGLELLCKKHYKTKDKRLYTNTVTYWKVLMIGSLQLLNLLTTLR